MNYCKLKQVSGHYVRVECDYLQPASMQVTMIAHMDGCSSLITTTVGEGMHSSVFDCSMLQNSHSKTYTTLWYAQKSYYASHRAELPGISHGRCRQTSVWACTHACLGGMETLQTGGGTPPWLRDRRRQQSEQQYGPGGPWRGWKGGQIGRGRSER